MATTASMKPKVWLVTACSSGFGREIVLAALARGDRVVATARDVRKLQDLQQRGARTLALDVTSSDAKLHAVVAQAVSFYGTIDVLVNNAAFLLGGAVEEASAEEAQRQFDTNVLGTLRMLRVVLPHMRAQRSGVVATIGSASGWEGITGIGVYGATKFALAGLSLALREEVAPLGIDVIIVEPGSFRTAILGKGYVGMKATIDDYAPLTKGLHDRTAKRSGNQPGDPAKAAHVIVELLTKSGRCAGKKLPSRLLLGKDAVQIGEGVLRRTRQEFDDWVELASSTDFDDLAAPVSKL